MSCRHQQLPCAVLHSTEILLNACKVLSRKWADCEVLQALLCLTGVSQS